MRIFWSAETVTMSLLRDLRHDAGAHRPPPLPDREPPPPHPPPRRQRAHARHVRRPKVELRPVPVEKRRVPPPLLLRQHVDLRLELPVRLDRPRLGEHLPPLYLLLVDPPQQTAHVVPRLPLVQELAEHLHPPHPPPPP